MKDFSTKSLPGRLVLCWVTKLIGSLWILLAYCLLASGCASHRLPPQDRVFRMGKDSFAYANELVWEYRFDDESGEVSHVDRDPPPNYSHHCFVVAKSARQFFEHARFDPELPRAAPRTYRKLIRRVTGRDPARPLPSGEKVVIPGYPNLYEFSRDFERLLKRECGGAWRSYTQRGHWRIVFPFSRKHQERTAMELERAIDLGHPPLVHLVKFPELTINHAVLLIDHAENEARIDFKTYDPNSPDRATTLIYDKSTRTYYFPRNVYFVGGDLDVFEVYKSWNY